MKVNTQVALAWIFILMLFGTTALMLYVDYQEDIRQGRIAKYWYPLIIKK